MPEDSQENAEITDQDIDEIIKNSDKKWEEMSDEEKLEKLEDI